MFKEPAQFRDFLSKDKNSEAIFLFYDAADVVSVVCFVFTDSAV